MGALGNLDHERFCQALHKRVWNGEKQSTAREAAYRDTMYRGENPDSVSIKHNARRLANRKPILSRLGELNEFSAKLAGVDSGWAMVKLKNLVDSILSFNLEDYLGEPDARGMRFFNLEKASRQQLSLLNELSIEEKDGERKIKLKGPAQVDIVGPLALAARIGGWEAPKKISATTPEGKAITLADLIGASMVQPQIRPPQPVLPAPEKTAA